MRIHQVHIVAAALFAVILTGCNLDPLSPISLDRTGNDAVPIPNDGETDDTDDDVNDDDINDGDDDNVNDDDLPPVDVPVFCDDGSTGTSWRSTLPALPAPVDPGAELTPGSAQALATCTGQGVVTTSVNNTETVVSEQAHASGRWYFEATVQAFESGWSQIGVAAPPADMFQLDAFFMDEISAAGIAPNGTETISVAADLDAGVAFFYVNGVRVDSRSMSLLPGIGAFNVGGVSMAGNSIRFNFGSAPFEHGVPAGYRAWSGNIDGVGGPCESDAPEAAPAAPISVECEDSVECAGETFATSVESEVELVVLGVYDSGSEGSWEWAVDDAGNVTQVTTGPGADGSVLVRVDRPGRIALVVSAYEPTDWTVLAGPDTQLEVVMAFGMHLQDVDAPDGVAVEVHTICGDGDGGNCATTTGENFPIAPHAWPFDTGGGDTQGFVNEVESRLCLPLKLFAGSYEARGFTVN